MRSTSCSPPCPDTASRVSRSRSVGTSAGPHGPGPSSCGASAARSYWEIGRAQAAADAAGQAPPPVSVPVGFTTFPGEVWAAPRSWVEMVYPNPTYFNEVDKGGHFAAWEQPQLLSEDVRATFRSLR